MKYFYRLGAVALVFAAGALFYFLDPAQTSVFPPCPFHRITGAYCPGCGSQRALHRLLHFDFVGVIHYNALFLPALLLVVYHYFALWAETRLGLHLPDIIHHRRAPVVVLVVVVVFWIVRNIPFYPFSVLAPG